MALLYRFAQLPDRSGTRVFSFVVTRSVVRDPDRDVTSKELVCGFQRWAVAFSRGDKVLGVYLVWRGAAPGLRVYVDFTFTLLNREHFSVNEGFSGKRVKFTYEAPAQGNRNYISVADLYSRNFADPNGEFQLELSMTNVRTVFTGEVGIPASLNAHVRMPSSVFTSSQAKAGKLETNYFTFGGFDWNLVVYPTGNKETEGRPQEGRDRLSIYLVRLTGFDHRCRVRYVVSLGEGDRRVESGPIEDLSDAEGRGFGWQPRVRWADVAHKGILRVSLEMLEARTISEVTLQALGSSVLPASPCYDRDKQAWAIRADLHSDTVRLQLIYKDIHNVPRNHLRYISWSAYLIRGEDPNAEIVSLPGAPFSRYYSQEPGDEGIIMETSIGVNEVKEEKCPFVTEKGQMRVRLEWNESHLLFQATYHKYDDVCRVHNQQMRREIAALQAENYSLERQLFSYQKNLAYTQAQQQHQQQQTTPGRRQLPTSPQRQTSLTMMQNDILAHEHLVRMMDRRLSNVQKYAKRSSRSNSAHSQLVSHDLAEDEVLPASAIQQSRRERFQAHQQQHQWQSHHQRRHEQQQYRSYKRRRATLWQALTGLVCSLGALATRVAKMAAGRSEV